jgi:AraC family transcriptional regulator
MADGVDYGSEWMLDTPRTILKSETVMSRKSVAFSGRELGRREFAGFTIFESMYRPLQEIPKHSHEQTYISIVLRGSYTEECGPTAWDCQTGQTILHVAGECHSDRFHRNGGHVLNLELLPPLVRRLCEFEGASAHRRTLFKSAYTMQLGLRLHKEVSNCDPWSVIAIEGLTMELLAEVFRQRENHPKQQGCDWLGRVTEILHERFREPVTLSELAGSVCVHPVHLARAFRKRYLCSVGDYLRKLRIEAACHGLLNSDAPIVEIALRCGFSDQSHLCRTLKQYTGMSPRHFRRARFPKLN